jgi:hypothetical protein
MVRTPSSTSVVQDAARKARATNAVSGFGSLPLVHMCRLSHPNAASAVLGPTHWHRRALVDSTLVVFETDSCVFKSSDTEVPAERIPQLRRTATVHRDGGLADHVGRVGHLLGLPANLRLQVKQIPHALRQRLSVN